MNTRRIKKTKNTRGIKRTKNTRGIKRTKNTRGSIKLRIPGEPGEQYQELKYMRLNVESKEMFKIDLDITNLRQDILGLTGSGIDIAK